MAGSSAKRKGDRKRRSSRRAKGDLDRIVNRIIAKGQRFEKKGDKKAAAACYLDAFNRDPTSLVAIKFIGKTLSELGQRDVAIRILERALAVNENDTDVISALGNMALDMREPDIALKMFNIFTALEPHSYIGYNNQATALRVLERFDDAVEVIQHALPTFPKCAELWNTLATIIGDRDGLEAAMVFYEEALKLNPRMASAASNLARALNHVGRFEEAVEVADRAIKVDPEFVEAHFVISTALLSLGQLERGWAEYEWRKHPARRDVTVYTHGLPKWDGGDLAGKRLLICAEQGIGDELLFANCFADMAGKAEQLLIGCDARLVSLFERSFPDAVVGHYVDFYSNAIRHRHFPWLEDAGQVDLAIEGGSLMQYLRPDFDSFPGRESCLVPDPGRVAHWRQRLAALDDNPKIGICWRSGKLSHERLKEYTTIEQWGPILGVPGATFINLQYDECADELAAARDKLGVTLHGWDDLDLKNDFEATTALSQALDLVICPTTAPGITAASVGTEWWALASVPPWWTYGQIDKSPEIVVCDVMLVPAGGGWDDVIATIGEKLTDFVAAGGKTLQT